MQFEKEVCEPEFASWAGLSKRNRTGLDLDSRGIEIRKEIFNAAKNYTETLSKIAEQKSLQFKFDLPKADFNSEEMILMSGHQPIIYHSGIVFKNHLLQKFTEAGSGIGINVIIDTDAGEGLSFTTPAMRGGQTAALERYSFSHTETPYLFQKIPDSVMLTRAFERIKKDFKSLDLGRYSEKISEFESAYTSFTGEDLVDSNTIIRRHFEKSPSYLEIRMSDLIKLSGIQAFFLEIFLNFENFFEKYNQHLSEFRSSHKIKNPANPFPNLVANDKRLELPFWVIDKGSQKRTNMSLERRGESILFFSENNILIEGSSHQLASVFDNLGENYLIVPKALLITVILRSLASDLFIHGLGGTKYDAFTDIFMEKYWGIKAPQFTTASASNYVFSDKLQETDAKIEHIKKLREIVFHADKYIDSKELNDLPKVIITSLIQQKKQLVEKIIAGKKARESVAAVTQELKKVEEEIRQILYNHFGSFENEEKELEDQRKLFEFREMPFFIFT